MLPNDPVMLLSYVNTQLRDSYSNLDDLCNAYSIEKKNLCHKLADLDYFYNEDVNQFK